MGVRMQEASKPGSNGFKQSFWAAGNVIFGNTMDIFRVFCARLF